MFFSRAIAVFVGMRSVVPAVIDAAVDASILLLSSGAIASDSQLAANMIVNIVFFMTLSIYAWPSLRQPSILSFGYDFMQTMLF
jgi:hypothetical protein